MCVASKIKYINQENTFLVVRDIRAWKNIYGINKKRLFFRYFTKLKVLMIISFSFYLRE